MLKQHQEKVREADEPIKVNIALNGKMSPLMIGREKGWFEEEFASLNAEIEWSEFTSGPPLLESLAANHVDLSFLGDGASDCWFRKKSTFRGNCSNK